jgi:serpin B
MNGQTISVPTMNLKNTFKIYFNSDFSMIEMDYGRKNFVMNILLPSPNKTPEDIIQQLDATSFSTWVSALQEVKDMPVAIPKFKFDYEKSLNQVLTAMGMGIAFSDSANFSQISSALQLLITEVKHKTYIEVNEEGTEAAAATSVGVGVTSVPPSFYADRPFVFVIRERDTQTILFIGKLCLPQ